MADAQAKKGSRGCGVTAGGDGRAGERNGMVGTGGNGGGGRQRTKSPTTSPTARVCTQRREEMRAGGRGHPPTSPKGVARGRV